MDFNLKFLYLFKIPAVVLMGIVLYLIFSWLKLPEIYKNVIILSAVAIGSISLVKESFIKLKHKNFALDYIAILAISVGVVSQNYLAAAVIVLMMSGGNTLEEYGMRRAKDSLTKLKNRIPNEVLKIISTDNYKKVKIESVKRDEKILIRKGEVIPLDGVLLTDESLIDQSSLTGEPYEVEVYKGELIRSGTINVGEEIRFQVTKENSESTYRKIINLVEKAKYDKSPFIRLAHKYSSYFTIVTLVLCFITYFLTHDMTRVLAVLVIATPCPLILATPIALMGGVNSAARKRIIIKNLAAVEELAECSEFIFDKTGTITLGKPKVTTVRILDNNYSKHDILYIAGAIEQTSFHPLAKAIVNKAKLEKANLIYAKNITESIGSGISGEINEKSYLIGKNTTEEGMSVAVFQKDKLIAQIFFEDEIKKGFKDIIKKIQNLGINLSIYTGDKLEATQKLIDSIGLSLPFRAHCSPQDKLDGIKALQNSKKKVAMVGDGLNDAPALAQANVGIVFSHEDQTIATESADIVLLGGDLSDIYETILISQNTVKIAKQSIFAGIGFSFLGMILASLGLITPIFGALTQEVIDVAVILNALRTSKLS